MTQDRVQLRNYPGIKPIKWHSEESHTNCVANIEDQRESKRGFHAVRKYCRHLSKQEKAEWTKRATKRLEIKVRKQDILSEVKEYPNRQ